MTFDEMEVGRWYWVTRNGKQKVCECAWIEHTGRRGLLWGDQLLEREGQVTDITPVPSQEEFRELVEAAKKIDELSDGYPIRETGTYGIPGSVLLALRTILTKLEGKQ